MLLVDQHLTPIFRPISYVLGKVTNGAPKSVDVQLTANMGSPKGREPYGDGKPIVVARRICKK